MSDFAEAGGRVLLLHGTTGFAIPFGNTVDWCERVVAEMGEEAVTDFLRFWLVPGFGHGSGAFQLRWQSFNALVDWSRTATPPEGLVATDAAPDTSGRTVRSASTRPSPWSRAMQTISPTGTASSAWSRRAEAVSVQSDAAGTSNGRDAR